MQNKKIGAGKITFVNKPFSCFTIISHIKDSLDLLIDKTKVIIIEEADEKEEYIEDLKRLENKKAYWVDLLIKANNYPLPPH